MRYSSAILAMATVASAKLAHKQRGVKRDPSFGAGVLGGGVVGVGAVAVAPIVAVAVPVGVSPVVLLYTNQGGGTPNQVINSQVTATQTVTIPQGGQPMTMVDFAGATQTLQPGATGTFPAGGATHTVTVGGPGGQSFSPQEVIAAAGDMVVFNFLAQNHSVTQSSFEDPCVPLAGGMDSGFMANQDNSISPPPQVAMQVMTTDPLWMYCAQGNHCTNGMVFSINPPLDKTHAQFQQLAIAKGAQPPTAIAGGAPGGDPAAAAPGAPPAGTDVQQDPALANPSLETPPSPPGALSQPEVGAVNSGALAGGVIMGLGTVNADGSCNCAVQCNAGGVGAATVPGVGLGGFGGEVAAIPMNAVGAQSAGSVGVQSTGGLTAATDFAAATIDPLGAASTGVGALSVDPLATAAASSDPLLEGAAIDPLSAPSGPALPAR